MVVAHQATPVFAVALDRNLRAVISAIITFTTLSRPYPSVGHCWIGFYIHEYDVVLMEYNIRQALEYRAGQARSLDVSHASGENNGQPEATFWNMYVTYLSRSDQ